ncbi:MAG: DMT family transporter [Flavobacteriales bacterium]|nr:DMT family transporter [Flavobacteriales bacterium]
MTGILIAVGTTMCWSLSIFSFTEGARRIGANVLNHFRLVIATLLLTIMASVAMGISPIKLFTTPLPSHFIWLGLSGIIGLALGDHFNFTSFAILGARLSSAFTTVAPIAALAGGYWLLGETLNVFGIVGMLVTISGILLLIFNKPKREEGFTEEHGSFGKGVVYALAGAVCQGTGLVLAKKGLTQTTPGLHVLHATWIRMVTGTIAIYTITILSGRLRRVTRPLLSGNRTAILYSITGAVLGPVIVVSLSIYAITLLKVSVAQTIFSLLPIMVLPIAVLYYKEKITLPSIAGAILAITGVVVLVWRESLAHAVVN